MNCPNCQTEIPDGSSECPICGAAIEVPPSPDEDATSGSDFIFCEGCGARLTPSDRTCPKCGRPAPGILSTRSASSDLAAGKTASFPRLTPDMLNEPPAVSSAPQILVESLDPESTNVLDAKKLQGASKRKEPKRSKARTSDAVSRDEFSRPRRGRWIVAGVAVMVVAVGAWFIATDPMGVMPGFYAEFDRAAGEMFPSREGADHPAEPSPNKNAQSDDGADEQIKDKTLSEDQAFATLSQIYDRLLSFKDADGELAQVVDDFNEGYMLSTQGERKQVSAGAFALRDELQGIIDQISSLKLADDSAYTEDLEHMRQLAAWLKQHVDSICSDA